MRSTISPNGQPSARLLNMTAESEVLLAATQRAEALGRGDRAELERLLHPMFVWTSHKGETFDRTRYLAANTGGRTSWHGQQLEDVDVRVIDSLAILRCVVTDDVTTAEGRESFTMPMTMTWVRAQQGWQCLAGHAGPRLR
jgi:hypothetical protein